MQRSTVRGRSGVGDASPPCRHFDKIYASDDHNDVIWITSEGGSKESYGMRLLGEAQVTLSVNSMKAFEVILTKVYLD